MKNTLLFLSAATASTLASAHAGHDHSHFLSDPIHALTAAAIIAVAATAVAVLKKRTAAHTSKVKH